MFVSNLQASLHSTPWTETVIDGRHMLTLELHLYCIVCRERIHARAAVERNARVDAHVLGGIEAALRQEAPLRHVCQPRALA